MKILSLFDGMACGMLAMQGAGITVDRYVAFEIDKYAVQTSSHNFPMIEHRGDVFQADFTEFRGFDFLIGGSPCTYWSIAQTNNRETEASGMGWELFSQYVRALHEAQPKFFIYENNKSMSKAIRESITQAFGFEPICINSSRVSAQNRQRLYWVGKRNPDGTYSQVKVDQPEDRGILLRDVLDGVTDKEKGRCVIGSVGRTTTREYFDKHQGNMAYEPVTVLKAIPEIVEKYGYLPEMFNAYNRAEITDKAPTLSTGSMVTSSCAVNKIEPVAEPCYVGEVPGHKGKYRNGKQASQQYRVYSVDGKSVACDTDSRKYIAQPVSEHSKKVICWFAVAVEWSEDGKPIKAVSVADGKAYQVYEVKDGQITIKVKQYPIKLADGFYIIRKLTVTECKRLQTVPEWYEFPVSDTQAYKMLGNGWTVDVIAHLIDATQTQNEEYQLDLFGKAVELK